MARAIRMATTGGPEVLEVVDVKVPAPGPGEITVRHEAIGVNFIDVYRRTGLYPVPLPSGLGSEAAGVVEAVGEGVAFAVGDRVAYATGPVGAYAEAATLAAEVVVRVPDGIDGPTAAAVLLKGMTAEFLVRRCHPAKRGEIALVHAAAACRSRCRSSPASLACAGRTATPRACPFPRRRRPRGRARAR